MAAFTKIWWYHVCDILYKMQEFCRYSYMIPKAFRPLYTNNCNIDVCGSGALGFQGLCSWSLCVCVCVCVSMYVGDGMGDLFYAT